MSVAAHAADLAAPHPQPPLAATGARPRAGGHTVKVPLRLVVGAQYPDAALSVYVKIAALSQRAEGCTAKVTTLAEYLGMSKSAVERGLKPLTRPDSVDGLVEVPTVRRTLPGGTGQSAHRTTRPLADGELWVRIPVRAAEALTPRLLRLYAFLAYATARRIPVTAAELGEMLHHHTGKKAGEHLGERQARRLVDELEGTGWLTVHRREGEHGRHAYETNARPLHAVPATTVDGEEPAAGEQLSLWDAEAPAIHDGSGSDLGNGSLASEEDLGIDRRDETQLGGGIRRRRSTGKWAARPVDKPVPDTFGSGDRVLRTDTGTTAGRPAAGRAPYTGPVLQLSPRVWRVLEPVRHELSGIRLFVLRKIARAIGAQLDAPGGSEQRLIDRLARRYGCTEEIRDIGRWILGAGLVRHGCGNPDCETGVIWPTGSGCETCALNRQVAAARRRRDAQLAERERQLRAARPRLRVLEDQEQRAPDAAAGGKQLDEPARAPVVVPPPVRPLPPKATYRERERATDAEIRAAIAVHGPAAALHIYGHLRTLPLLNGQPHLDDEFGRTTYAQ